jgi:HIRAN domain
MTAGCGTIDERSAPVQWANTSLNWISEGKWRGWGWPENAVHGESFRQDAIRRLSAVTEVWPGDVRLDPVVVEFRREPDNPVDAAACMALVEGIQVGYLAAEYAAELAPIVDAAGIEAWKVAGAVVGGLEEVLLFGVHVWLGQRLTPGPRRPTVELRPRGVPV